MAGDRRKWIRYSRLLSVEFRWQGGSEQAVTTDISPTGAFVNCSQLPPEGTAVALTLQPDDGMAAVEFCCEVTRVVDAGSTISTVPGVGVRWLSAMTSAPKDKLAAYLGRMLGSVAGQLLPTPSGGSRWQLARPSRETASFAAGALGEDIAGLRGGESNKFTEVPVAEQQPATVYVDRQRYHCWPLLAGERAVRFGTRDRLPRMGGAATTIVDYRGGQARLIGVITQLTTGAEPAFEMEILRVLAVTGLPWSAFVQQLPSLGTSPEVNEDVFDILSAEMDLLDEWDEVQVTPLH